MQVDSGNVLSALLAMEKHHKKLLCAAARAGTRGDTRASESLTVEATGVEWAVRRLTVAMLKRPAGEGKAEVALWALKRIINNPRGTAARRLAGQ